MFPFSLLRGGSFLALTSAVGETSAAALIVEHVLEERRAHSLEMLLHGVIGDVLNGDVADRERVVLVVALVLEERVELGDQLRGVVLVLDEVEVAGICVGAR